MERKEPFFLQLLSAKGKQAAKKESKQHKKGIVHTHQRRKKTSAFIKRPFLKIYQQKAFFARGPARKEQTATRILHVLWRFKMCFLSRLLLLMSSSLCSTQVLNESRREKRKGGRNRIKDPSHLLPTQSLLLMLLKCTEEGRADGKGRASLTLTSQNAAQCAPFCLAPAGEAYLEKKKMPNLA